MKNIEIKSTYQIEIGEQTTHLSREEVLDLYYKLEKILNLNRSSTPVPINPFSIPHTPYAPGTPASPIKHPWENPIVWNECGTGHFKLTTYQPSTAITK